MPDSGMTAVQVERVKEALEKAKTAIQWTIDDFGKGAPSTAVATAQAAQPLVDEALALFPNPEPEKDWADEVAADIRRVLHAPPDVMNEAELAALIRERCPTHGEEARWLTEKEWRDSKYRAGVPKEAKTGEVQTRLVTVEVREGETPPFRAFDTEEPKTVPGGFGAWWGPFCTRAHQLGARNPVGWTEDFRDCYAAGKQEGQREQRERDADTGRLLLAKWPTCTTHYKNGVRDLMRAIEQEGGRG